MSDTRESELLCEVRIFVVPFTFEKLALILDDSKSVPDAEHDLFMEQVMSRRFLDFGRIDPYALWGSNPERSSPINVDDLQLSYLATYQHLIWHANMGTTIAPNQPLATLQDMLGTYLSAGGRLFLVGDRLTSHIITQAGYPKDAPPQEGDDNAADFQRDSFIWTHMRMRNTIVGKSTGGSPPEQEASGLVGARSLHPAYPDIDIDASKWNPWLVLDNQFQGGILRWEGVQGRVRPIQRFAGMDSLYSPVTFDTTYRFGPRRANLDDAVIGWRYEATRADTVAGTEQGRMVVLDFQPYYFDPNAVQDAGTSSINWLMTGLDH